MPASRRMSRMRDVSGTPSVPIFAKRSRPPIVIVPKVRAETLSPELPRKRCSISSVCHAHEAMPDAALDELAAAGFEWIWLLSVWKTGAAGRQLAQRWRHEYQEVLPDLTDDDIVGSGFAISGYTVSPALGGDEALARMRERLRR